jgi:hypothetical protein
MVVLLVGLMNSLGRLRARDASCLIESRPACKSIEIHLFSSSPADISE